MQVSYSIGSGTAMQENQPASQIAAKHSIFQGCGLGLDVSVSRRSRDLSKVSSRSRLGHVGTRLGLVSVSGAKVSVLVSVSTV